MLKKIYRKLFPVKGLIINHDSSFIKELKILFPNCDVIHYKDFTVESASKYKYVVLSGGSIDISGENDVVAEKEFIRTTDKPVFGICLGFQIVCIAFGAKLKEFTETNNKPSALAIQFNGKKSSFVRGEIENRHYCYIEGDFFLPHGKVQNKYYEHITLNDKESKHFDSITKEPVYNAICVMNGNIFATQGHPEISGKFGKKLRDCFLNYYVH